MTVKIINDDCLKVMKNWAFRKNDLIITSPPYNDGKEYEDRLNLATYKRFAKRWVTMAAKILTDCGSLWVNLGYIKTGDNQALPLSYLYYEACPLPLVQEIVWYYEGGMTYSKRFAHRSERWLWFAKDPKKAKFNLSEIRDRSLNRTRDPRNHPDGKNPTDVWFFNRITNNSLQKWEHPCPFPTAMITRIVEGCSDPGDHVLDPFMGSGTVGYVCKTRGRSFTGIEINTKYCKVAKERIGLVHFATS